MTQKEKLFIGANELSMRYKNLIDENNLSTSAWLYGKTFADGFNHKYTCSELRDTIKTINNMIDSVLYNIDVNAFYSTDEGMKLKNELSEAINKCETEYWESFENDKKHVKEMILSLLPKNWDCKVYDTSLTIGIKDNKQPNSFLFGHSFDAYYNSFGSNKTLEFNYGTLGGFNPLEAVTRVEFIKGISIIISNVELITELNKIYTKMYIERRNYYNTIDELTHKLKYPIKK